MLLAILIASIVVPAVHISTTRPVVFNIEAMMMESMQVSEAANMTDHEASNM